MKQLQTKVIIYKPSFHPALSDQMKSIRRGLEYIGWYYVSRKSHDLLSTVYSSSHLLPRVLKYV